MLRQQFTEETKRILAQRAAYRCSSPNCNRLTIGPGLKEDQVENTGTAAHIYSASRGGPRGQSTLTSDQLKAPSNGIWMCGHHANLIDKNTGIRYPAWVIKGWKALHEYRIACEHSGRTSVFGFVRQLHVDRSSLFESGTKIELGKTTLLVGSNDTGKTALCEWLASVDNLRRLWRWFKPTPLAFKVTFDAPTTHCLSVTTGGGSIEIDLDGSTVPFNLHRISVAFLENRGGQHYQDDLERISDALNLDGVSTRSLAGLVKSDTFHVKAARFELEKDDYGEWKNNLYCTIASGVEISFGAMSGGERGRVMLEFAIAQMRNVAVVAPALLIIEWHGLGIDNAGLKHYLEYFSSTDCSFQTLITFFQTTPVIEELGWQTYQIIRTKGDQLASIQPVVPTGVEADPASPRGSKRDQ